MKDRNKQFIEYYINEYNNGSNADRILVKFTDCQGTGVSVDAMCDAADCTKCGGVLKLSTNNEIYIKSVECIDMLLKQRDDIERLINSIDSSALINHELTKLGLKSEEKMYSYSTVIEFTTKLRHFINECDRSIYDVNCFIKENLK